MSAQLLRAQVLLDRKHYQRLQSLANQQGKSLSETIREAVLRYLDEQERQELEQFRQSLEEMRQIRQKNAAQHGVYQGNLVDEARQERLRQMEDE